MQNHPDTKHTEVNEMEYISQKILAEHAELEESKRAAAGALWKASKSKFDDLIKKIKGTTDDAVKKADDANKVPDPWDDAAKKADDAVKSKADDAAKTVKSKADDAAKKADDTVKSKADDVAKKADDVKKPKKTETIPAKRGFGGNKGKRAFVGKTLKGAGLIGLGAAGLGVYNALKGSGDKTGGSSGSGSTYSGGKVPGANISYDELRQKAAAASARGAGKDYRRDIARGIRSTSPGVFTKSDSADDPKSSRTFTRATTTPTPTTKTTTTKSTTPSTPSSSGKYVSPDLATLRRRAAKATMVGPSPEAQKLMSKKALAYFGKDRLAAATKAHQNIRKPMLVKEMTEQTEAYDVILEYLLDNGHADTINEANYIMLEMDSQSIQTIVEMGMPDPIDPMKHKAAQRTQKIYNKAKGGAGSEKDFLKRTGPQLPGV